jgi:hypothetical protein
MMTRSSLCVLCCLPAASMGLPAACQGLTWEDMSLHSWSVTCSFCELRHVSSHLWTSDIPSKTRV